MPSDGDDREPENVFLLEQDGTPDFVKIVDFGVAKRADRSTLRPLAPGASLSDMTAIPVVESSEDRLTQPGMVMGTPQYMSPEQAQGMGVDSRTDQYAL